MAYARPYNQNQQGASPWSSGAPPGLQQQQQQQQQPQSMFNQPMGAYDISGAWPGQQPTGQQLMVPMQAVQFVPNPAFMQQANQPQQHHQMRQPMHQQQRGQMHQRSLSAPRVGVNVPKRSMNQNHSFGGPQQQQQQGQWQQRPNNQNNNNNNNNVNQQRTTRQQTRMNNQRGQQNSNNNANNNNNNPKQQHPRQQRQQQQQQQQPQQNSKQAPRNKGGKITKAKKVEALKAKQNGKVVKKPPVNVADSNQSGKPPSKTAERRQMKIQARKAAEALSKSKLPVSKTVKTEPTQGAGEAASADADPKKATLDEPIDQAQLKCVPAVFGFVCKLCDVFLKDKIARREHIDSEEHMERFNAAAANSTPEEQKPIEEIVKSESPEEGSKVAEMNDANAKNAEAAPAEVDNLEAQS